MKNTFTQAIRNLITPLPVILIASVGGYCQSFTSSKLQGLSISNPTSLQFGPDKRLYASEQSGGIKAFTINRVGPNNYTSTATEIITLVKQIPNHNDDGTLAPTVTTRQVTGIVVTGTAAAPILYVSSSDSRIGGPTGDLNLDTNSGIVSKLTKTATGWTKIDLVRGLPRSEENHAPNGLQLDATTNMLYLAVGGHTNAGSPSNNFAFSCEYALSAAILSINLNAIEAMATKGSGNTAFKYDLPTVDDPTRSNTGGADVNDPFGGNNGLNQAKIVPGGPVQVFAAGFRNSYDILITKARRMYTIDNGANQAWGGYPANEGGGAVNNSYLTGEPGSTGPGVNDPKVNNKDNLHFVGNLSTYVSGTFYGGHPNPIRANPAGAGLYTRKGTTGVWRTSKTDPTNPLPVDWPPVPVNQARPIEGDFQNPGEKDNALLTFTNSTNGITEYTASNFNNAMKGNILAAAYNGDIIRIKLNANGDGVLNAKDAVKTNLDPTLASNFGSTPLDMQAQGDNDVFPGTLWVTLYGGNGIMVFEPQGVVACTGANNSSDEDGDGYKNSDEIANGTNPCSASSKPPDNDKDLISDLTDPDDDNDGLSDKVDFFALDAKNGLTATLPIQYNLFNNNPGTGFFGLGFTGLMSNGSKDYLQSFNENNIIAGGAVGVFTVVNASVGDCDQSLNTQENAFQFGVNVTQATGPFTVRTSMLAPFFNNQTPKNFQSQGLYIGTGDQSNYVKIALNANGGARGIEVVYEKAGVATRWQYSLNGVPTVSVDCYLSVDPVTGKVQPKYARDGGAITVLGSPIAVSGTLLTAIQGSPALAIGVISTSRGATPFSASWDLISVTKDATTNRAPVVSNVIPNQTATVGTAYSFAFAANTFSDPDGNPLTYSASLSSNAALPAWLSFNATTRTFSGTPPSGGTSPLTIKVTASDGKLTVSTTFTLTINPAANRAPVVSNAIPNQTATIGTAYSFAFAANTFTDPDGNPLTYSASLSSNAVLPAWLTFNTTTRTFSGMPPSGSTSPLTIKVTASDGKLTASTTFTLTINPAANRAPVVANAIPNQTATIGAAYSFTFAANTFTDPDGNPLTYSASLSSNAVLPAWLSFNATTRTFSGTPPSGGTSPLTIKVTASDGKLTVSTTFTLTINPAANRAPVVANAIPNQTATETLAYSFAFAANTFSDPDGNPLTYSASLSSNAVLPAWLSFNATTRTFSGTPPIGSTSPLTIKVTASDSKLTVSTTFSLTITVPQQVVSFTLINADSDLDLQTLTEGASLNLATLPTQNLNIRANTNPAKVGSVVFSLSGQQTRSFTESGAPYALFGDAGGNYNAWVPAVGSYSLKGTPFTAATGAGTPGTALTINFTVVNQPANRAPVVANAIPNQAATEGTAYSFAFPANTFSDADNDPLTYSASLSSNAALPAWLTFNATTRTFSGTPLSGSTSPLTIKVTASDGQLTVSTTFTLTIQPPANQAPVVSNAIPNQAATVGVVFNFPFAANTFSDPDGNPLTYSATLGDGSVLPAWLTFNATTRTFSGTPPNLTGSPFTIKVTASDGKLTASTTFTLTINPAANRAPVVSNAIPNQTATETLAYSFAFAANTFSDPDNDPLTYSATLVDGLVLPAWLSFNATTRTFSGTPPIGSTSPLTIKVTASDSKLTVSTTFSLTITVPQQVVSFTLINADSDLDLQTLTEGASLNLATLPTQNLNIRANTNPAKVGSVVFSLSGQQTRSFTESGAPYALFGDAGGNYNAWVPAVGSYSLKGTPFTAATGAGTPGTALTINFTVVNQPANRAPVVANAISNQTATEGTAYSFAFPANTFSDPDNDPLTYSASLSSNAALPAWLTFNATTRTFSGTPLSGDAATLSIQVTAGDGQLAVSTTFTLTIQPPANQAPVVSNAISNQAATVGVVFNFTFTANTFSDPDGNPLTYSATLEDGSVLPAWLTFDPSSSSFSGTPPSGGTSPLTIKVTASDGQLTVSTTFTLTIQPPANQAPIVLNPILDQNATVGVVFNFTFAANTFSDPDGNPLTYSATLGDGSVLPAWLIFDPSSSTFSGSAPDASVSPLSIKVTASDGQLSVSTTFTLTIAASGARLASSETSTEVLNIGTLLVAYPNPMADGQFKVSLSEEFKGELSYVLVYQTGMMLVREKLTLKEPSSVISFDLSRQMSTTGVYYLRLEGQHLKGFLKLQRQ